MKIRIALIIFFTSISVIALALIGKKYNPENEFVGSWEEIDWNIKGAEKSVVTDLGLVQAQSAEEEDSIRFHVAKSWKFKPGGILILEDKNEERKLEWRLKGRGHILEISDGVVTEFYDINLLSDEKIELNYIAPSFVKDYARLVIKRSS